MSKASLGGVADTRSIDLAEYFAFGTPNQVATAVAVARSRPRPRATPRFRQIPRRSPRMLSAAERAGGGVFAAGPTAEVRRYGRTTRAPSPLSWSDPIPGR